ncbi:hypothetical protein DVH24_008805 [Malus domestica]|uniref:Uncharacterized protein n=1 Tax=Malus domestica TaxID=3750 RepID=A0A498JT08_MALDO|nr:hypothetical protein DVH24_008805 [Malus domestica]
MASVSMPATVCDCSFQTPPSGHGEQIVDISVLDRLHPIKMKESKHLHLVGDDSGAPPGIALSFSPQCYSDISILEGAFLNPMLRLDYGEHQ